MSLRPFLCHARADRSRLEVFSTELSIAGADGWQDVNDLRLGRRNKREIRRVLAEEAGGLIWFGTPAATNSKFIRRVEVPAALVRSNRGDFPLVPVFADLRPSELRAVRFCWPRWRTSLARLIDHNGIIRDDGEADELLWQRASHAYVRHAVLARGNQPARVAISCVAAPERTADIVLDWRSLIGASRTMDPRGPARAHAALANLRKAFQEAGAKRIEVSAQLFLPLAVLVGLEFAPMTGLTLVVEQRTQTTTRWISVEELADPFDSADVEVERQIRGGVGPTVVVVSTPEPIVGAVARYCDQINAREVITLHAATLLDRPMTGVLARQVAAILADLTDRGVEKHLLIRGPVSLAVLIGAAGNTMGRTTVPLWNGDGGYGPGLVLGGAVAAHQPDLPRH